MNDLMVVQEDRFIAPVVDIQVAKRRYQDFKDFVSGVLREQVDFGVIPGTDKPTLLKPGAEKLATFFGLSPRFQAMQTVEDWTGEAHGGEMFFYFHYRCQMMRGENVVAEGEGSANSWEKKYRYRQGMRTCPTCGQAALFKSKNKPEYYCWAKKGGCGATYPLNDKRISGQDVGQVKNPDVADVVNTLQKMAQKRAYVAAVLLAVNGSEYFTQDVEDYLDGSYSDAPDFTPSAQPPQKAPQRVVQMDEPPTQQPAKVKASQAMYNRFSEIFREAVSAGLSPAAVQPGLTVEDLTAKANELKAAIAAAKENNNGAAA